VQASAQLRELPDGRKQSARSEERARGITLRFAENIPAKIRARMDYAFRVFSAIFGHRVRDDGPGEHGIIVFYGASQPAVNPGTYINVPARYGLRMPNAKPPWPTPAMRGQEKVLLFHGVCPRTGQPDWLGEIFEWLSANAEAAIPERDEVGRIPSAAKLFAAWGISPRKAHLMPVMAWLEACIRGMKETGQLPRAPSPVEGVEHFVVCSHDIDYYWTTRGQALKRSIKNLAIATVLYWNQSFFWSNAASACRALLGKRVGEYLPALLDAGRRGGFRSTFFAIARHEHARDANYRIDRLAKHLELARQEGFGVALHGSYRSVIENRDLASEVSDLVRATSQVPLGNRQHWLRFDRHESLFRSVQRAGLQYDSTLGFPETPGFRNGAAFAFPPYDFANEKPFEFLEIPLVLMDGNIEAEARACHEEPREVLEEVLRESRRWGWGGISALWHNPLEELHVPKEINGLFWECIDSKSEFDEAWTSAEDFMACCIGRFHDAGLLRSVKANA
jgi:hypothetical protein